MVRKTPSPFMANAIKNLHFFREPIPKLSHSIYIKIKKLEKNFGNQVGVYKTANEIAISKVIVTMVTVKFCNDRGAP